MNRTDLDDDTLQGSALVATFASRDEAHQAVSRLHDEGFHKTWIGVTSAMDTGSYDSPATATETRVESDNALARFFGAGDESLHEALLKHGVSSADAERLDGTLPANSAVVTVDGANHPELAAQIVAECGGKMVSSAGSSRLYDAYADKTTTTPTPATTGMMAGALPNDRLKDLGDYRSGEKLDEARRLQLREERLSVDKERVSTGEATVGKKVVTERSEIDVPVMHEELYIERRPASGTYGDVGEIGAGETISVPLSKEVVNVEKRAVVTEEVAVGQRRVEGVEHVSETLKKEQLIVDDKVQNAPVTGAPVGGAAVTDAAVTDATLRNESLR